MRLTSLWIATLFIHGLGAQETPWQVPSEVIRVDFNTIKPRAKVAFLQDGFAWETQVHFAMLRPSLTIAIKHPEAGRAEAVMQSSDAVVELKTTSDANETRVTVQGKLPIMGRADAAAQARKRVEPLLAEARKASLAQSEKRPNAELERYLRDRGLRVPTDPAKLRDAYADAHAAEDEKEVILQKLEEFAAEKPNWLIEKERVALRSANGNQRLNAYLRLLQLRIAEQHLELCGLHFDTSRRNFDALLFTKLDGVYALSSGNAGASEEMQRAVRALTREDFTGLKKALTVSLSCRFYPRVDSGDPNCQWYNAQRLHCPSRGITLLVVHGQLNASRGDSADWWTLVGYDEASHQIKFSPADQIKHTIFPDGDQAARLRISAVESMPIDYTIEIVPREETTGESVVLHETPDLINAKFPF